MPYATQQDLVDRFGSAQLLLLADRDGDGVLDAAVVAQAIADAAEIVDLHVRGKYAVPLSPVDGVVTGIVCDLARTKLYGNATEITESVAAADKAARDLLKQISAGTVTLSAAPAPAGEAATGGDQLVEMAGPGQTFTHDSLKGF